MFATFNKLLPENGFTLDTTAFNDLLASGSINSPLPLTADALETLLMTSSADNPSRLRGTKHWLSEINGLILRQMLQISQVQSNLFRPFGAPESLFTGWAQPLIQATEDAVSRNESPDMITQADQQLDTAYAEQLKSLVSYFTEEKDGEFFFNEQTCHWACKTLQGQVWLMTQLNNFRLLEWQYHSRGQTHLTAMKNLLRSLFQVITGQTFSADEDQPYRKKNTEGQWRDSDEDYLKACAQRLLELLKYDAFDLRNFALNSPYSKLGATPWETVAGSELYSVKLRHYPRPKGVKANGKTLYMASPMINRCELFDLAPGKSVIEGMLQLGYDLYLVDYGNPEADQSQLGLDFYGKTVHDKYLDLILERHPGQNIEVMAYCMGGTLFMPYLARRIEEAQITGKNVCIRQVVLMTTPILFDDESSGHKPMRDVIRQDYDADVMQLFYGNCNVSPYAIESGMHAIQPGVEQTMLEGFYSRANFPGAIEDSAPFLNWLHSGTRFPARAHREWIQNIFMDNQIWEGQYCLPSEQPELDGKPVNMDALNNADIALFDYAGLRDPIAPVGSCKTSERWGRKAENHQMVCGGLNRTIEKNIGHIFVVSHALLGEFLEAVTDFLSDEPPAYQGKKTPVAVTKTAATAQKAPHAKAAAAKPTTRRKTAPGKTTARKTTPKKPAVKADSDKSES
ncbi:alpha/beta hydrolase [Oceanospirillum linum]|uniref:AB hydrolase-1 domain-containing protein n=1 Tax=Oceanospirillum linum TaxID=966 RepID=A0A1T1HFX7_OCELI|nr:alpha/beta hydrolase [Oceanospirillum linum]OOV88748.1 hypothetical protein BTA35_0204520 [Oceanospirillum linum]SEG00972.1 Poly(3-hydroxyalkanoate) synthetase [Oleiphilus messinensis]SMP21924.1 Poly(3-hydroxyalkanoate) synthetase [Oceanospirillum linum]